MNTTTLYLLASWFLLGLIAKGIIRGNNAPAIADTDLSDRKDRLSLYWMLRWERDALLLGPIGLFQVINRCRKWPSNSFTLRKFSLKPHKIKFRLAYLPTYYNGRLIAIK